MPKHPHQKDKTSDTLKRIVGFDWETLAGLIAAVTAIVLHFLHIVAPDVLLVIAVILMALLFLRDVRREREDERVIAILERNEQLITRLQAELKPPEMDVIGPAHIRDASERFSREAYGEMIWFHVCLLMFKPQWLFDVMLRPAIENPAVTRILFVIDPAQRDLWHDHVLPKVQECSGREKVVEPHWVELDESVSIILSANSVSRQTECLLSFWGEPFMSHAVGRDVPRYVCHVKGHSELAIHLHELIRKYRLKQPVE